MNNKVKIGIIGAGKIAQIAHIPQWQKITEADLVAICDIQPSTAEWVAEKYGVQTWTSDPEELFKNQEIEVIDICTDTQSHKQLAIDALSAGKHVIVEKPMASSYADAMRMVDVAEKYNRLLMAAMNVRFRKEIITLKSFIEGGDLGEIYLSQASWFRNLDLATAKSHWLLKREISGGGVMMDLGIQMLDAAWWLMGNNKPSCVKAKTYHHFPNMNVEDTAVSMIEFENGSVLNLEVSWSIISDHDKLAAKFYGTQASAIINPLSVYKKLHGNLVNIVPSKDENSTVRYIRSYHNELKHFITCIRQDTNLLASGREIAGRLKLIEAIYQSAIEGREVVF